MKLFKNVDIKDLPAILRDGILPISVTGNDNWDDGRRAENSREVVYLFDAERGSSFINYGAALIEVDVDGATVNGIGESDANAGAYTEYIVDRVDAADIVAVYVPEIFAACVPAEIADRVTAVGIRAKLFDGAKYRAARAESIARHGFKVDDFGCFANWEDSEIVNAEAGAAAMVEADDAAIAKHCEGCSAYDSGWNYIRELYDVRYEI